MYDIAIIGAGPAGMTAAIYAARKQLGVLVLTKDIGGQTLLSSSVENYLGYNYISGEELVKKFEDHLNRFDVDIRYESVTTFAREGDAFLINTDTSREYSAHTVIIASGKTPRILDVPGEDTFMSRGITYCAICDAPLFAGKDVVVVGGGNSGADAVIQLAKISPKVYLIEASSSLSADEALQTKIYAAANVEIITETEVIEIKGSTLVESVTVKNKVNGKVSDLRAGGVFIEVGLKPNVSFLPQDISLNNRDEIIVDKGCRTNIKGVFAAGDVTDVPEKQIIIAAGEGAKAALSAYDLIVGKTDP